MDIVIGQMIQNLLDPIVHLNNVKILVVEHKTYVNKYLDVYLMDNHVL